MTLNDINAGQRARVVDVRCEKSLKRHLGSLGLFESVLIQVICKNFDIAIVEVLNSRIALATKLLENIEVEKL